jgi:L-fucose isomerase-like protein
MCRHCLNRREFIGASSATALVGLGLAAAARAQNRPGWESDLWDPNRPFKNLGHPLTVQPVLMYSTPQRREATSWKSWGGIQTEEAASEEANRTAKELKTLSEQAGFPIELLPVAKTKSPEEAEKVLDKSADVTIVYPATGSGQTLQACCSADNRKIVFLRHRSGPVYYWYEALSVRYLATGRSDSEAPLLKAVSTQDVVVDDTEELLKKLRALYGVKNLLGTRIVALGGPWGKYASDAPQIAKEKFGFEIIDFSYEDLAPRIEAALADAETMAKAEEWTARFLALPGTELETDRSFVVNAFVLYGLFKDILAEKDCTAFTIKNCMNTIMPMSRTTACLTLGLLNDEGLLAFCESDFVIIPAGILLRHITGKPVFLHNSTFPHKGMVTCAHCASPRRMDGDRYEPTRILTHYESEFGAAPKVEMPIGQQLTFIDPEYTTGRWIGFRGKVESNPFYEICRSQQDVLIEGDWKKLLNEARDSHWMMAYGDYLEEVGYAARKVGIEWENLSEV